MTTIQPQALIELAENLLRFPQATICVHHVAASLLSILVQSGVDISSDLAAAVVGGDDETGLKLLAELRTRLGGLEGE